MQVLANLVLLQLSSAQLSSAQLSSAQLSYAQLLLQLSFTSGLRVIDNGLGLPVFGSEANVADFALLAADTKATLPNQVQYKQAVTWGKIRVTGIPDICHLKPILFTK